MTPSLSDQDGTGFDFEDRARAIARAIYDPMQLQGAMMFNGSERDAVFIGEDSINAFEFTKHQKKDKAEHDGAKLVELLKYLTGRPENRFKAAIGWFVTLNEPHAEQREVIRTLSRKHGVTLNCISAQTLRSRVCDIEGYLSRRGEAPFGSIAYTHPMELRVPPIFVENKRRSSVKELTERLLKGERFTLTGEFGVGKSHALRELYLELRRRHFKDPATQPFPVHINLGDCAGLRTPAEIFRRHSEEIGFSGERGLISAWRAGACVLVLDGFDEVIPTRWLGSAANLRGVRWEAISPIRKLIEEAPAGVGIIAAGRGHYFSRESEMMEALGMEGG